MKLRNSVCVVRGVRLGPGRWQIVSLPCKSNSPLREPCRGICPIESWEEPRRRRKGAGQSPADPLASGSLQPAVAEDWCFARTPETGYRPAACFAAKEAFVLPYHQGASREGRAARRLGPGAWLCSD